MKKIMTFFVCLSIPTASYSRDSLDKIIIATEAIAAIVSLTREEDRYERRYDNYYEDYQFERRVNGHYCVRNQRVIRGVPVTEIICQ